MTDDQLGPETLSTRGVPSSRRGYDKRVIDALLGEARSNWQAMQDEFEALRAAVDEAGGLEYLGKELGAVAREVGAILAAAQEAADGMRTRAREDAERIESEATAGAKQLVEEAERQAFEMRRDAWEAGGGLLEDSMSEAAAIVAQGEDDALLIKAQGEKDAHRHLAAAKKEGDDIIRTARYEADRQLNQAREVAQEIIDRAWATPRPGESMPPDPVTEERRRELLAEIERLRTHRPVETVQVFANEPMPAGKRVEPEAKKPEEGEPDGIDLSDAMAAEVERLRDDAPTETVVIRTGPGTHEFGNEDDVGTLFEALRTTGEMEPVTNEESLPSDPFELRDTLLLPAINAAVRDVKRRIVDLQNVALDALRSTGWEPSAPDIASQMRGVLEPLVAKAGSAGARAAYPLAGIAGAVSDPGDRAGAMGADMAEAFATRLQAVVGDSPGPEQAAAALGRVFRTWRNDDAERWVRAISHAAYHDSLAAALRDGGVATVAGVASPGPCAECPAPTGKSWPAGGAPPEGTELPPAHLECACTIGPGG